MNEPPLPSIRHFLPLESMVLCSHYSQSPTSARWRDKVIFRWNFRCFFFFQQVHKFIMSTYGAAEAMGRKQNVSKWREHAEGGERQAAAASSAPRKLRPFLVLVSRQEEESAGEEGEEDRSRRSRRSHLKQKGTIREWSVASASVCTSWPPRSDFSNQGLCLGVIAG